MYNQEYPASMAADPKNGTFPEDGREDKHKQNPGNFLHKPKANIPHLGFPLCNRGYKPEYSNHSIISQVLKQKINAIFSSGYKNKKVNADLEQVSMLKGIINHN